MISIIIIVKDDIRVRNTLIKLRSIQRPEKVEVIVVDASVREKRIASEFPEVKWINYKTKKHKITIPEQRNIGVKNSTGNIVVFIDADCTPEKDWLIKLTKLIEQKKEHITAGACLSLPKTYMDLGEMTDSTYMDECASMNMALSRGVFNKVGLFDENFERVSDSDICLRARKAGYKIRAVPDAIIFHDWGDIKQNLKRSYGSGIGRTQLYRKYPDQIFSSNLYKNRKNLYSFIYMTYIILLPVSVFWPYYLLIPFIASVVLWRNPLKEVINLAYGLGMVREAALPRKYQK